MPMRLLRLGDQGIKSRPQMRQDRALGRFMCRTDGTPIRLALLRRAKAQRYRSHRPYGPCWQKIKADLQDVDTVETVETVEGAGISP